jgi:hypothetical protein
LTFLSLASERGRGKRRTDLVDTLLDLIDFIEEKIQGVIDDEDS